MMTTDKLMRLADAYAKDHALQGRWAESREELERGLAEALKPQEAKSGVMHALVALAVAAGFAYASWQQYESTKEVARLRQQVITVTEDRDRLAEFVKHLQTAASLPACSEQDLRNLHGKPVHMLSESGNSSGPWRVMDGSLGGVACRSSLAGDYIWKLIDDGQCQRGLCIEMESPATPGVRWVTREASELLSTSPPPTKGE